MLQSSLFNYVKKCDEFSPQNYKTNICFPQSKLFLQVKFMQTLLLSMQIYNVRFHVNFLNRISKMQCRFYLRKIKISSCICNKRALQACKCRSDLRHPLKYLPLIDLFQTNGIWWHGTPLLWSRNKLLCIQWRITLFMALITDTTLFMLNKDGTGAQNMMPVIIDIEGHQNFNWWNFICTVSNKDKNALFRLNHIIQLNKRQQGWNQNMT